MNKTERGIVKRYYNAVREYYADCHGYVKTIPIMSDSRTRELVEAADEIRKLLNESI